MMQPNDGLFESSQDLLNNIITVHDKHKTFYACLNYLFQRFALQLKAEMENVTNLKAEGDDFRWYFKVREHNTGFRFGAILVMEVCCVVTLLACFDHGTSLLLTPGACILMLGTSINDYNTSKHAAKFVMYMYVSAQT